MSQAIMLDQSKARAYTASQLATIKKTIAADCNDTEFDLFTEVCRLKGLDPFSGQIVPVIYNKNKPDKRKMTILTGIGGLRAIAARCEDYRPDDDDPVFVMDEKLKGPANPLGIEKCSVNCYKQDNTGAWFRVRGTAYWDEYCPLYNGSVKTGGWLDMPRIMISKCAESVALRKGWPEVIDGLYSEDEMEKATDDDLTASAALEQHNKEERIKLVGGVDNIALTFGGPISMIPLGEVYDRVMEYCGGMENQQQLHTWRADNSPSLNQYWAFHKSDALVLKTELDKLEAELPAIGVVASEPIENDESKMSFNIKIPELVKSMELTVEDAPLIAAAANKMLDQCRIPEHVLEFQDRNDQWLDRLQKLDAKAFNDLEKRMKDLSK